MLDNATGEQESSNEIEKLKYRNKKQSVASSHKYVQNDLIEKEFREKFFNDASDRFLSELSKADDRSNRTKVGNLLHVMRKKHTSKGVTGIVTGMVVLAKGASGPLGWLLAAGKATYSLGVAGHSASKSYQRHVVVSNVLRLTEALEQDDDVVGGLYNDIKGVFEEVSHELKRIFWHLLIRIDMKKERDLHRLVQLCIKLVFEFAHWNSDEVLTCETIVKKIVFTDPSKVEKITGIKNNSKIVVDNNELTITNVFRKQGICIHGNDGQTKFINKKTKGKIRQITINI